MSEPLTLPSMDTFSTPGATEKDYALKVIEEAAELLEAIKTGPPEEQRYEAMDVCQELANLIVFKGWSLDEMRESYRDVYIHNLVRGRYEKAVE